MSRRRPSPPPAAPRPGSALEEVGRLEAAADDRQRADEEARERVAQARREAEAALAAARTRGEQEAARLRAALLAAADRDAERIQEEGRRAAAEVRYEFERRLPDLLTEALRLILPAASLPSRAQTTPGKR